MEKIFMNRSIFLFAALCCFIFSCRKDPKIDTDPTNTLKINQVQIIASHNSYHLKPDSAIVAFLYHLDSMGLLPGAYHPRLIDYAHPPMAEQMDNYGIRGLEIDLWNDPAGGHFYNRQAYVLLGASTESHIAALNEPGFKVIHVPDFDFNTTAYTFKNALVQIKSWSDAHPNHLPLFVNVETGTTSPGDELASSFYFLTKSIPFDAGAADNLDVEVKSVFGENLDGVITPDEVRGTYATLEEAVLAGNWPTLGEARGKIIFIIDAIGNVGNVYAAGHASLHGRAMFMYATPGTAEAAFVKLNAAVYDSIQIRNRVQQGYIVRTRTDADTEQARTGNYSEMNAAFASGAQIISTDYYKPDPRAGTTGWTGFRVRFPNGELARINPVSASSKQNLGIIKE